MVFPTTRNTGMLGRLIFIVLQVASEPHPASTVIHEKDQLYFRNAKIGEDVTLHCLDFDPQGLVEWRVNGTAIPKDESIFKTNGGLLAVIKAQLPQEGEYSCHRPGTGELLARTQLQLGYPPGKPVAQCWAVEYPNTVQCSWNLEPHPLLNTTFITTYWHGMSSKEGQKECIQSPLKPNSCTISDFEMFSITPYVLNLTAMNPLGAVSTVYPFIVEEIIKPDPPENVIVSPIHGQAKKLRVRWDPPKSWPLPQYFPLNYMIRYKRAEASAFITRGPYLETSVDVSGIWPRMAHTVQVNAKDLVDGGEASDWSPMVSATPWRKH